MEYTIVNLTYNFETNLWSSFISFPYEGSTRYTSFVVEKNTRNIDTVRTSQEYKDAAESAVQSRIFSIVNPLI